MPEEKQKKKGGFYKRAFTKGKELVVKGKEAYAKGKPIYDKGKAQYMAIKNKGAGAGDQGDQARSGTSDQSWFEKNKMLVIGGAGLLVLFLIIRKK